MSKHELEAMVKSLIRSAEDPLRAFIALVDVHHPRFKEGLLYKDAIDALKTIDNLIEEFEKPPILRKWSQLSLDINNKDNREEKGDS